MALVLAALRRRGAACWFLDQHAALSTSIELEVGDAVEGTVRIGARALMLKTVTAAFIRPYDGRRIPAVQRAGDAAGCHATALDDAMATWADLAPALVVNRPAAMAPNGSKPYQAELIRAAGMEVPDTLVTTDQRAARAFVARHGRVVYKAVSGVRSVVSRLGPEHRERLGDLATCPTQFQAFVPGIDVRAHVVGGRVFACRIDADEDDYRYPRHGDVRISRLDPGDDVAERWVRLTAGMGLHVAGIDLRLRPDGAWVCFEVNPSPAFSFYQEATEDPIDEAVAELLVHAA
ncbi:MAG TPA: RimK domain-containing protein ATP-grasp [Actinomycetes bacterium]